MAVTNATKKISSLRSATHDLPDVTGTCTVDTHPSPMDRPLHAPPPPPQDLPAETTHNFKLHLQQNPEISVDIAHGPTEWTSEASLLDFRHENKKILSTAPRPALRSTQDRPLLKRPHIPESCVSLLISTELQA